MPESLTSRVDVRKAVLATATTLSVSSTRLNELARTNAPLAAASQRLAVADQSLVRFANALATYVNRRYSLDSPYKEALLMLKVDSRDLEDFSGDWLHAAEPPPSSRVRWQMAHLVNAIDFGRWVVALSAGALATQRADPDLHTDAVRTILDLDLALTELTRALLGTRARCLADWSAA